MTCHPLTLKDCSSYFNGNEMYKAESRHDFLESSEPINLTKDGINWFVVISLKLMDVTKMHNSTDQYMKQMLPQLMTVNKEISFKIDQAVKSYDENLQIFISKSEKSQNPLPRQTSNQHLSSKQPLSEAPDMLN